MLTDSFRGLRKMFRKTAANKEDLGGGGHVRRPQRQMALFPPRGAMVKRSAGNMSRQMQSRTEKELSRSPDGLASNINELLPPWPKWFFWPGLRRVRLLLPSLNRRNSHPLRNTCQKRFP